MTMRHTTAIVIARSILSGATVFVAESKDRDEAIPNLRRGDCFAKNARNDNAKEVTR